MRATFARFDPLALGGAVGVVAGVGLFLAAAVLLLRGGDPIGPTLSLLGNFLLGFQVTWLGSRTAELAHRRPARFEPEAKEE